MRQVCRRRGFGGFTLIEIVIVMAVLSLFCILAWQILSGWMGSGVTGIWRQTTNKELGTLAAQLRSDLGKGSYPAAVTPEDTVVAQTDEYFITIMGSPDWTGPDSEGDPWDAMSVAAFGPGADGALDTAEEPFLVISQSSPGKSRIPGFPDTPVEVVRVTYYLAGGAPVYGAGKVCKAVKDLWIRTEKGQADAGSFTNTSSVSVGNGVTRRLVQGVNEVLVGVATDSVSSGASDPTSSPTVKVRILCVEPAKGKTKLATVVTSQGQTGVKFQ